MESFTKVGTLLGIFYPNSDEIRYLSKVNLSQAMFKIVQGRILSLAIHVKICYRLCWMEFFQVCTFRQLQAISLIDNKITFIPSDFFVLGYVYMRFITKENLFLVIIRRDLWLGKICVGSW